MEKVLTRICEELNNWFTHEFLTGDFTIENGSIALPDVLDGQYVRIVGSALNDGVYRYPVYGLTDETFNGSVWLMRVPLVVLDVAAEIEAAEGALDSGSGGGSSPYSSESFNGYSYSRATNKDGTPMSEVDAAWASGLRRLRPWRKMP